MKYEKTRQIYVALLNLVVKISLIVLQFDKKKLLKLTLAWSLPLSLFCTSCSIGWICRSWAAASAPFSAGISVKMAIAGGGNCNSVGSSISCLTPDGRPGEINCQLFSCNIYLSMTRLGNFGALDRLFVNFHCFFALKSKVFERKLRVI